MGVPVVCPCTGEVYIAADFKASLGTALVRGTRGKTVMLLVSTTGGREIDLTYSLQRANINLHCLSLFGLKL